MKSYLSASYFPLIDIGGVSVPRLILGHMPFVGESYQGTVRNREYCSRFMNVENTVKLLIRSVEEYGVTVTSAMPAETRLSTRFLHAVKIAVQRTGLEIALIPCFKIPLTIDGCALDDYRRWVTYYHIERKLVGERILERYVDDPILQCRARWTEKFPQAVSQLGPYREAEIRRLQLDDKKLEKALDRLDGFNVILVEPGSESDFLALTGRVDLLDNLIEKFQDRFHSPVVVGIHHAGSSIPILETRAMNIQGYVTPINRLGALMLPTFQHALGAIQGSRRPIIAIKPLAGGRLAPEEAFKYVYNEAQAQACMVGVASKKEMDQDFREAAKYLVKR